MLSMGSNDHMDWLPGLGTQSRNVSDLALAPRVKLKTGFNMKAADRAVDEVQFSIMCNDCGKHFWSRYKANSHAALTAHVLHEDIMSPSSPVIVPISPAASSTSAPRTNTLFTSATDAETSPNTNNLDQEDSKDIGDEEFSICSDCGRHFWSHEAADNHARTEHMQDTEMVPSSVPDGSPTFSATSPAITPTSPAANPGINLSPPYWNTDPDTASLAAIGGTAPTSPSWITEQTTRDQFSPTSPYSEDEIPTFTYGTTSPTSGHATALFREHFPRPLVPNVSQRVCIFAKKVCC